MGEDFPLQEAVGLEVSLEVVAQGVDVSAAANIRIDRIERAVRPF